MHVRLVRVLSEGATLRGLPAHVVPLWTRRLWRELYQRLTHAEQRTAWKAQPVRWQVIMLEASKTIEGEVLWDIATRADQVVLGAWEPQWVTPAATMPLALLNGHQYEISLTPGSRPSGLRPTRSHYLFEQESTATMSKEVALLARDVIPFITEFDALEEEACEALRLYGWSVERPDELVELDIPYVFEDVARVAVRHTAPDALADFDAITCERGVKAITL